MNKNIKNLLFVVVFATAGVASAEENVVVTPTTPTPVVIAPTNQVAPETKKSDSPVEVKATAEEAKKAAWYTLAGIKANAQAAYTEFKANKNYQIAAGVVGTLVVVAVAYKIYNAMNAQTEKKKTRFVK